VSGLVGIAGVGAPPVALVEYWIGGPTAQMESNMIKAFMSEVHFIYNTTASNNCDAQYS
jgi:hypothetical protein